MSTSDTPIAQQGRRQQRNTRTPTAYQKAMNLQAHSLNAQTELEYSFPSTTPPRTPRRTEDSFLASSTDNGYTSNDAQHVPRNSSAIPKSRTKNRPKHVVTSPPRHAHSTPPLNGPLSAGLTRPVAYAGPTFHASPAPSALPMPSFFSKSVPESPAPISMISAKDETDSSSGSDSPTAPTSYMSDSLHKREESPLDFFFVRDRAERAQARGSSSGIGPFQPPFESPPVNKTPAVPSRAHSSNFSGGRPSSMFAMELESTNSPGKPVGAPFATPYSERIKAARSSSTQSQPLMNNKSPAESPSAQTQALKDYLFLGTPPTSYSPAFDPAPLGSSIRSTSGPSTPVGGVQTNRHPSRSYHSDFPFGNQSVPQNSFRNMFRTSGLRQEIVHAKTPVKRPQVTERVTSAPPKIPTHSSFVNTSPHQNMNSVISASSPPTAPSNASAFQRSRSDDLHALEQRLRGVLKLEPAKKTPEGSFPYGPPDSAPAYRATAMNGGFNGVLGS